MRDSTDDGGSRRPTDHDDDMHERWESVAMRARGRRQAEEEDPVRQASGGEGASTTQDSSREAEASSALVLASNAAPLARDAEQTEAPPSLAGEAAALQEELRLQQAEIASVPSRPPLPVSLAHALRWRVYARSPISNSCWCLRAVCDMCLEIGRGLRAARAGRQVDDDVFQPEQVPQAVGGRGHDVSAQPPWPQDT